MVENWEEWVLRRARCNVDDIFAELQEQVEQDVAYMKSVTDAKNDGYSFQLEREDGRFVVQHYFGEDRLKAVVFRNSTRGITIEQFIFARDGGSEEFNVRWKWNEQECKCELFIDDELHEVWQVSQKALSPMFFPLQK